MLGKYAGKLQWVSPIFQPRINQAATLLPALLKGHGQDAPAHADAGSSNALSRALLDSLLVPTSVCTPQYMPTHMGP